MKNSPIECEIVGIGASAGGLGAFQQLLKHLPIDTGKVFVLVQHLDPTHESLLTQILSRSTMMPVTTVQVETRVQPNHIYVIPANTGIVVSRNALRLVSRQATGKNHLCIDYFFESLAKEMKNRAVGVILSGSGFDGSAGLQKIKSEGGRTFAQNPKTAKFPEMPRHVIETGCVDSVLSPADIGRSLARLSRPSAAKPIEKGKPVKPLQDGERELRRILTFLSQRSGVNFLAYKQPTMKRRIAHRMGLQRKDTLGEYAEYLESHPAEITELHRDMLIKVTSFFRDPDIFQILQKRVFPQLLKTRAPQAPLRIWIPGCATGEEAYSITIVLLEFLGADASHVPIQVFATDVSEEVIKKGRAGFYPDSIRANVSDKRLRQWFSKVEGGFRISKRVRDLCIFAKHDISRDPPFSSLDLISCRNLLIYLNPALQKTVLSIFHYALKPTGLIVLGPSETVPQEISTLFSGMNKKQKIYFKRPVPSVPLTFGGPTIPSLRGEESSSQNKPKEQSSLIDLEYELDRLLLHRSVPACVIVDAHCDIVQFRGDVSPYLQVASGKANLNIFKMVREGLLFALRSVLRQAAQSGMPVSQKGVIIQSNGRRKTVNLEVAPLQIQSSEVRYFVVFFEKSQAPWDTENPAAAGAGSGSGKTRKLDGDKIERLIQELAATRRHLQTIIQEHEATNEELQSANEEMLSSNEELQSTNEEMESAKEELQSVNQELTTVNEQLQNSNQELVLANNDLYNVLDGVNLPILILGSNLKIRRFTPMAEKLFNLISTDVGRPLTDIKSHIMSTPLEPLIREVFMTSWVKELEVQDERGHWYVLRIRPYLTRSDQVEGAMLIFVDIDALKKNERAVRELNASLENRVKTRTAELARSNDELERFASVVSHDLQEPLRKVSIYTDLLISNYKGKIGAEADQFIEYIIGSANRMRQLITDLLSYARIGQKEWHCDAVDFNSTVRSILETLEPTMSAAGAQVTCDSLPTLMANGPQMMQLFQNLLGNALKFHGEDPPKIHVSAASGPASQWIFCVQDNGVGIDPEHAERIFNVFERLYPADQYAGSGIGLSICKRIIERHGGRIWLKSEPGKGAAFYFSLPGAQES